jgi:DNA invertase Pin-like site-specific DNA recombinase
MQPLAVSYQRFSSPKQAHGDSVRRQTELRDQFLKRNGLVLADDHQFRDEGVSSFRGKHRDDRNELGRFLGLVKSGRIPRGSYLILESLDRLSREHVRPATLLLLNLIEAGVRVVQLAPVEVIYDENSDAMALMIAILELSRGNSESAMKSERSKAAWEAKRRRAREKGVAISRKCPAWLRREGDRYEVLPERAAVVRRLFELCADGYGIQRLIRKVVAEGRPVLGTSGKWNLAYVGRLLRWRAVLGEFQPLRDRKPFGDPIPDFYPAVVSEGLFYRAQAGLQQRRSYGGGHSRHCVNLFQSLLFNADDGDSMELKWFKNRKGERPFARYVNSRSLSGYCPTVSIQTEPFERAILEGLEELKPKDFLPEREAEDGVAAAEGKLREVEAQLAAIEERLVGGESVGVLERAAKKLEQRQRELRADLEERRAKANTPPKAAWGQAKSLIAALQSAPDPEAARVRLQAALRRLLARIDCLFVREGSRQIACAQLRFRDSPAVRTVFVCYRYPLVNSRDRRPAHLSWRTLRDELPAAVDLQKPKYRRVVRAVLEQMVTESRWIEAVEPSLPSQSQRKRERIDRQHRAAAERQRGAKRPGKRTGG